MGVEELSFIAGAFVVFAALRFGIPILLTWAVGDVAQRTVHHS